MTAPQWQTLPVMEKPQPWQQGLDKAVVGYNALNPAGEVTAPVVYANFGRPEDSGGPPTASSAARAEQRAVVPRP